jgi:hypothetical protein
VTGNTMNGVKEKLETDANWVIRLMASTLQKATLIGPNFKSETKLEIIVGNSTISSSKLLESKSMIMRLGKPKSWKKVVLSQH